MSEVALEESVLPDGWKLCQLGDVVRLKNGYAFKSGDYAKEGIPLVRISDIQDGKVSLDKSVFIPEEKANLSFAVTQGDLLIAMSGATTGKTGVYSGLTPCLQNQRVGSFQIIARDVLDDKYRNYYVKSLRKQIEEAAYGGAQPNISAKGIEAFPFPLAPMAQQKRIVAEIEKQFSRLDEAVANLKRVKANLKRYKAAVLKAAVEGKLACSSVGCAEKPFVQFCQVISGFAFKSSDFSATGIPVVKIANVSYGTFIWKDQEYLPASFKEEHIGFVVCPGDILLALTRPITNGLVKACRYPKNSPDALLNQRVALLRPGKELLPEFLLAYLQSEQFKNQLQESLSETLQPNLSPVDLKKFPTNIPDLEVQKVIVSEVERRLSIVAGAEAQVDANLRRADRLRQSILKQAFSGQLVPQDANDEPASVLLERIRATQPAQTKQPAASQRKCRTPSPKPGAPSTEPLPMVAESTATYGDAIAARILAAMQPGREYARADLVEPLGLTTGQWNAAIQELKRVGKLRQVGEKRGARYLLNGRALP